MPDERHGAQTVVAHKRVQDVVRRVVGLQLLKRNGRGESCLFQDLSCLPRPDERPAQDNLYLGHEPHGTPGGAPETLLAFGRQRALRVIWPALVVTLERYGMAYQVKIKAYPPSVFLFLGTGFLYRLFELVPALALYLAVGFWEPRP